MKIGIELHDDGPHDNDDGTTSLGRPYLKVVDIDTGERLENFDAMVLGRGDVVNGSLGSSDSGDETEVLRGWPDDDDERLFGGRLDPTASYLVLAIRCDTTRDCRPNGQGEPDIDPQGQATAEVHEIHRRYQPTHAEMALLARRLEARCRSCGNSGVTFRGRRCGCLDR